MNQRSILPALTLIVYNLLPIVGVIFWDWSLFTVLLLYWLESGVIGFFNLLKIGMARAPFDESFKINKQPPGPNGKLFVLLFFPFHYGMFWIVHGVFVILFFGAGILPGVEDGAVGGFEGFDSRGILFAGVVMLLNHALAFVLVYVGDRVYLHISPDRQMMEPYSRVFVLHAVILGGAWLIVLAGTPIAALALLAVLKMSIDLTLHFRSPHAQPDNPVRSAGPEASTR